MSDKEVEVYTYKFNFKLVRSFSLGFTMFSPKLNGFCFEINIACFSFHFWNRGKRLIDFVSYWNR